MSAVGTLEAWFEKLSRADKVEVLQFLYGGTGSGSILLQEGLFVGPRPEVVKKGLFLGPTPTAASACSQCGRPY